MSKGLRLIDALCPQLKETRVVDNSLTGIFRAAVDKKFIRSRRSAELLSGIGGYAELTTDQEEQPWHLDAPPLLAWEDRALYLLPRSR